MQQAFDQGDLEESVGCSVPVPLSETTASITDFGISVWSSAPLHLRNFVLSGIAASLSSERTAHC